MKKEFGISSLFKIMALAFAIICLAMFFCPQLYIAYSNSNEFISFNEVLLGTDSNFIGVDTKGAIADFVAYLVVIVCGLVPFVLSKVLKDSDTLIKVIDVICVVALIAGGIILLNIRRNYFYANGWNDDSGYHMTFSPIVAGVLSIVSGVAIGVADFVFDR